MYPDFVLKQLTPLTSALNIFGLSYNASTSEMSSVKKFRAEFHKEPPPSSRNNPNIKTFILLVFVNGFGIHCMANYFYYTTQETATGLFSKGAILVQTIFTVITVDLFLYHKTSIYRIFDSIANLPTSEDQSKFKIMSAVFVVRFIYLAFVLQVVTYGLTLLRDTSANEYIEVYLYNSTALLESDRSLSSFVCVVDMVCFYMVGMVNYFIQALTVFIAVCLYNKVNAMEHVLRNPDKEDITLWGQIHTDVFNFTTQLDGKFNVIYGLWLCSWMIAFLNHIPLIYANNKAGDTWNLLYYTVTETIYLICSSYVSGAFAKIEASQCGLINAVHLRNIEDEKIAAESQIETKFLMAKINSGKLQLSVLSYCIVTKGFLLNLYGFMTTFVVFIIQEADKVPTNATAPA